MLNNKAYRYQYDQFGNSPDNLVTGEDRTLTSSNPSVIVPLEGLFFGDSLVIKNGGTTLVLGTDYELEAYEAYESHNSGKAIYAGIKRLSSAMNATITLEYQCLGGPQGVANAFVKSLTEAINNAVSNPTVNFNDLIGVPTAIAPAAHKHKPSDLEDLDLLAQKFDDWVAVITATRFYKDSNLNLRQEIDRVAAMLGSMRNSINAITAITGAATDIANLQNKIENISREATTEDTATASIAEDIYTIPVSSFSSLGLRVTVKANDDSASVSFTMNAVRAGTDINITYIDASFVGAEDAVVELGTSDVVVTDASNTLTVTITPKVDASYTVKELYAV